MNLPKTVLTPSAWRPMTDIYETKEAYVFKVELPGFKKEDIKVEFSGDTLTLRGERKQEEETKNENCHRLERSYGMFERSFTIPKNVDAKKIDAALQGRHPDAHHSQDRGSQDQGHSHHGQVTGSE